MRVIPKIIAVANGQRFRLVFSILMALFLAGSSIMPVFAETETDVYGVVQHVEEQGIQELGDEKDRVQQVTIRLDEGSPGSRGLHHQQITLENRLSENPAYHIPVKPGSRVLLTMEEDDELANPSQPSSSKKPERTFYLVNRDRTPALMTLFCVTLLALLIIGGSQAARHGFLVFLMLLASYRFLFPSVLAGSSGWVAIFILCITFPVLAGLIDSALPSLDSGSHAKSGELEKSADKATPLPTREEMLEASLYEANTICATKTTAGLTLTNRELSPDALERVSARLSLQRWRAILGTWGGTLILLSILWIMHLITPLNGFASEGLAGLWYQAPKINFWLFYLSSALIGYQGLLFHLCRTLARQRDSDLVSGSSEFQPAFRQHFGMIMRRGQGVLGPLISSLGLLYLGLLLPTLLLLNGTTTAQLMNLESTASSFTFFFAGTLALILTVPLMAPLVSKMPLEMKSAIPKSP